MTNQIAWIRVCGVLLHGAGGRLSGKPANQIAIFFRIRFDFTPLPINGIPVLAKHRDIWLVKDTVPYRRSNKLLFSFKTYRWNCFLSGIHFFVYGLINYVTKVSSMVIFVHPRKCKHNYSISSISPTGKVGSKSATQWWKCFFYAVVNIMLEK